MATAFPNVEEPVKGVYTSKAKTGLFEGVLEGVFEGEFEGYFVGDCEGANTGDFEGENVGEIVGLWVVSFGTLKWIIDILFPPGSPTVKN